MKRILCLFYLTLFFVIQCQSNEDIVIPVDNLSQHHYFNYTIEITQISPNLLAFNFRRIDVTHTVYDLENDRELDCDICQLDIGSYLFQVYALSDNVNGYVNIRCLIFFFFSS